MDSFVSERIDPELRGFADEGMIYFQDEASQLAARILSGFGGQMVLDVCAAPGSKATSIARDRTDSAQIFAADLHFRRAKLLKLSALKQKAALNILCLNAESSLPFPEAVFDTIIVDAPCSGTGTIRRNPEIRYRVNESDIKELQKKQLSILSNASDTLKPGGVLLYSTCSLEPQENEMVVEKFLEHNTDFMIIRIGETGVTHTERGFIRTFPDTHHTDGFFIACMRRI
jgi:16S rRNA (cytosine967-C5)-methyltransferase